jgi:hypothetical protein
LGDQSLQYLLPPKFDEIIQPDFSVKESPDVDLSLQKSRDQSFTTENDYPRIHTATEIFSHCKIPMRIIDLAKQGRALY